MKHHETYIAGAKFRGKDAVDLIEEFDVGDEYKLDSEPTNKYDKFAVKVFHPNGDHVGYVPAMLSEEVTELLMTAKSVRCVKSDKGGKSITVYYEEGDDE